MRRSHRRGFTLVELAVVLAVAAVIFAGLWRLMSTGSQQLTTSSAASQQMQVINSVKAFLASSNGQGMMAAVAANTAFAIPLPSIPPDNVSANLNCKNSLGGVGVNAAYICDFLPLGFSSTTTNPYNQTYNVDGLKDSNAAGTAPRSYSFMIATTGGNAITDAQGGSISSQIGGDGGFVYSTNVCGAAATTVCGAYGAWTTPLTAYFPSWGGNSGHVATRTFVSPDAQANLPWLARQLVAGDTAVPGANTYNTMSTPLALQTSTGLANLYLNGGQMTSAIGGDSSSLFLRGTGAAIANPQITTNSGCAQTSPGSANCPYSLQVTGDAAVSNFLQVGRTIYTNSDMRLKTNVETVRDPLDGIMRVRPVSFNLRNTDQKNLGVVAQELEKIYPELVTPGSGMKSVNYQGLIAPLIGAVQQLKRDNDELRAALRVQTQREDRLEQALRRRAAP